MGNINDTARNIPDRIHEEMQTGITSIFHNNDFINNISTNINIAHNNENPNPIPNTTINFNSNINHNHNPSPSVLFPSFPQFAYTTDQNQCNNSENDDDDDNDNDNASNLTPTEGLGSTYLRTNFCFKFNLSKFRKEI